MDSFSFDNLVPPRRTAGGEEIFVGGEVKEAALVPAANEPVPAAEGPGPKFAVTTSRPSRAEAPAKPLALLREVLVKPLDLTPAALGARGAALDEAEGGSSCSCARRRARGTRACTPTATGRRSGATRPR